MKVLLIAPADSPHTVSIIKSIKHAINNLDIYVYSSVPFMPNDYIRQNTSLLNQNRMVLPYDLYWHMLYRATSSQISGNIDELAEAIEQLKPDIVHWVCMQDAGYLLAETISSKKLNRNFKVVGTSFANDLYYFAEVPKHHQGIKQTLTITDVILTENYREIEIAPRFGFSGRFVFVPHASMVTKTDLLSRLAGAAATNSAKNAMIIKGGNYNRSINHIIYKALPAYFERLEIEKIYITSVEFSEWREINKLKNMFGPAIEVYEQGVPNTKLMNMLAASKYSISLNWSDGNPLFFFESCALSAIPIFSTHSSLNIYQGVGEFMLVDPADENDIRRALDKIISQKNAILQIATENQKILNVLEDQKIYATVKQLYQ